MLIIFGALKVELSGLIKVMSIEHIDKKDSAIIYKGKIGSSNIILVESGMGKENAQKAARLIVKKYLGSSNTGAKILVIGFCGATSRDLESGDIVLYKSIKNLEGIDFLKTLADANVNLCNLYSSINIDYNRCIRDNYKLLKVDGGSVSKVIIDSKLKKAIGSKFDVQVIDTETYWIGREAVRNKLPFCCIRSVSDDVDENVPDFLVNSFRRSILVNISNLLFLLVKSPKKVFQIAKVIRDIKKARNNLTAAVKEVV